MFSWSIGTENWFDNVVRRKQQASLEKSAI